METATNIDLAGLCSSELDEPVDGRVRYIESVSSYSPGHWDTVQQRPDTDIVPCHGHRHLARCVCVFFV